ncbi:MAG: phosphomannose isomerase type II C-terminal cupin domain [Candidatus Paceibacterota bacterium]
MAGQEIKPFQIEKPWGNFRQFTHNVSSTVKILTVNKNEALSLQSHTKRSEFWKVIQGDGIMEMNGVKYKLKEGDESNISAGATHRIIAGPSGIKVLEISTGDFDEEDIIRYEDKYGRK